MSLLNRALVIGAGIGGLTAAIALRARGINVEIIEKDPSWSVYGVGIIQQANVIRAVAQLGILDDYVSAGFPFDAVEVYTPSGQRVARIPTPRLTEGYPANLGIGRPALHRVLGERARSAGADIRLGVTAVDFQEDDFNISVQFSNGDNGSYDLVIGADGLYSETREMIFPDAQGPRFVGQGVWRYNFPRSEGMDALCIFEGPIGLGLVPLSADQMYMFVTTPESGHPWYPREGLAAQMREKMAPMVAPQVRKLAEQITDDDAVVYKPLEVMFQEGPWHRGRVVLLGDAIHASTPHLGQGAGMAIEDSLVLADELARGDTLEDALTAFRDRRYERCKYIVEASLAICEAQIAGGHVDQAKPTREMFEFVARPI